MVATNDYKTDNKAYKSMYFSAWLFVLVLILNIWLYFYNSSLDSKIEGFNKEITTLENTIKEINNDDKVKLYTLIKTNKVFLDKYAYLSRVPEFINNIKELSNTFKVTFNGFSYSDSVLSTSVTAVDDGFSLWYQKAEKLIWSFRDKKVNNKVENNKQLFSLNFVDSFEWQNEMKFNINFKIR